MKTKIVGFMVFAAIVLAGNGIPIYSQPWGAYTLYAPKNGTIAYLIDLNNTVYKTWTFPSTKKSAYSAYLLPGDTLLRTYSYLAPGGMTGGGVTGGVQKVTWDGTVAWDYQHNGPTFTLHHDIHPMPNGNVLMIAYELKTAAEASQAGASTNVAIKSERIIEVKPTGPTTGTIVWEWRLWDHLCQNFNPAKDNYVTSIANNPQLLNINYTVGFDLSDRWHMNGIDYNAELDQIVVSMHFMNSAFIIDHSTTTAQAAGHTGGNSGKGGDFIYRWGNPASYNTAGPTVFNVIHDAHWIPANNPKYPNFLCAYNNLGAPGNKTAVTIWRPPYNGTNYLLTPGQAYGPPTYAFQYNTSFNAQNEGNSHQLPNGNMLINNSFASVFEIDSLNTVVWSKLNTNSSHVYRYSLCYVRGPIVSCSASATQVIQGTPVTLNASARSVTETNPSYSYAWTSTPPGFTSSLQSPIVTPTENTTYKVTVTNNTIGCFSSASVTVNVNTSGTIEKVTKKMKIFPIPTKDQLTFELDDKSGTSARVNIFNRFGQLIFFEANYTQNQINVEQLSPGLYNIVIEKSNTIYSCKFVKN